MSAPGVVVVHGGGGLPPHVEEYAEELAMAGFVVEAVDLLAPAAAGDGTGAPDATRAVALVAAAADRLRDRGAATVGAVGFSAGGDVVLRAAGEGGVDAVVAYDPDTSARPAARAACPVQLHVAVDGGPQAPHRVATYVAALEAAGTPVDHFVYPGASRGSTVPGGRTVVDDDAAAADVARARTIGFLHARLAR